MQNPDQRLRLAAATRLVVDRISAVAELALDAELLVLADQLVDLELELLHLHSELLELGRQNPQLRRLPQPARADASDELPF
jgi:hypothetical protein